MGDSTAIRVCTSKDPWCWQSKAARRRIRESFDATNNVASALAVYDALTEIASDDQSETFQTTHAWIQRMSGVSVSTIKKHLGVFIELGLVRIKTASLRAPSTYTLLALANHRLSLANGCPALANASQSGRVATSEESKNNKYEESENQTGAPVPGTLVADEETWTDPDLPEKYWEKDLGSEPQSFWDSELNGIVIWCEGWLFDHSDGHKPVPPISDEVKAILRARKIAFSESDLDMMGGTKTVRVAANHCVEVPALRGDSRHKEHRHDELGGNVYWAGEWLLDVPPSQTEWKKNKQRYWCWQDWLKEGIGLARAWGVYLNRSSLDQNTESMHAAIICAALNHGDRSRFVVESLFYDDYPSAVEYCMERLAELEVASVWPEEGATTDSFTREQRSPPNNKQKEHE